MKEIVQQIMTDARYLKNIEYGRPRPGHPERKVKYHIAELEENLETLKSRGIAEDQYWKLKFLIHVHDTFKAEAVPDSAILHPNSHASLARKFASEFTDDTDLLNMIQYHDVNFALWKQFSGTGFYDTARFSTLLETIMDWDLFLMFLILDGSTSGKDPVKIRWFIKEVRKHKETIVDESWLLQNWTTSGEFGSVQGVLMSVIHPQPISITPGSGTVLKLLGVTHKLTRAQTGGAYYLFEFEFGPGAGIVFTCIVMKMNSFMF
ncbi:MAG: hypothetical protein L0Z71_12290 [Anaerolineae bacterium]|nr:hypothetical protein [Anaerolineae bacterium]